ncbi:hypothetical protein BC941DRAFT_443131 [Chlamydoabsidia padenii]|nr:hypothetical protein BC941DRAFT_443131 [Chlamydoabsidia padenii]
MKTIGWYSGILLLLWSIVVNCYPSAPGTCNMDLMGTIGHGPSKSTCNDCYRILVQPVTSSISDITIKIVGTQSYQGLMLLVKDQANQTVGRFVEFDDTMFAPVACDDESIEEESVAVIGHVDPRIKSWPIQVGWQSDHSGGDYRVQGMVVIDYDNFHMIPEQSFKLERKPISTTTLPPSSTGTVLSTDIKEDSVDMEMEEWPLESVNSIFIKVVLVLMVIYVVMSMMLRHVLKYKQQYSLDQQGNNVVAPHFVKTS